MTKPYNYQLFMRALYKDGDGPPAQYDANRAQRVAAVKRGNARSVVARRAAAIFQQLTTKRRLA